jgi:antitoxin component YwqK of YwqJK toxin-antitoxin module
MRIYRPASVLSLALSWAVTTGWASVAVADPGAPTLAPTSVVNETSADASEESPSLSGRESSDDTVEVVRTRYPNRAIKIEREVRQDANRNYINDGSWTMWDPQGNMLAKGQYRQGKMHGKWSRWFLDVPRDHFAGRLYDAFEEPLMAETNFVDGQVHGSWMVYDAKKRKVCEWQFDHDHLNGKVTWWHPNGETSREETYVHGILDGDLIEYNADGSILSKVTYDKGRKFSKYVKKYTNGDVQIEGWYLNASELTQTAYDWWNGTLKIEVVGKEGVKQREGKWVYWHPNGGRHFEGEFRADKPIGRHTWWFSNGQKRLDGEFLGGKQHGRWVWWHENGQKHIDGSYVAGVQTGTWVKWLETGRVVEVQEDPSAAQVAESELGGDATTMQPLKLAERPEATPPSRLEVQGDAIEFTPEAGRPAPPTRVDDGRGLLNLPTLSPTRRR